MEVNAFWFGFLIGLLAFLFVSIFFGVISRRQREQEFEPLSVDELKKLLEELCDEEETNNK